MREKERKKDRKRFVYLIRKDMNSKDRWKIGLFTLFKHKGLQIYILVFRSY